MFFGLSNHVVVWARSSPNNRVVRPLRCDAEQPLNCVQDGENGIDSGSLGDRPFHPHEEACFLVSAIVVSNHVDDRSARGFLGHGSRRTGHRLLLFSEFV
jgi:hypothetical protein